MQKKVLYTARQSQHCHRPRTNITCRKVQAIRPVLQFRTSSAKSYMVQKKKNHRNPNHTFVCWSPRFLAALGGRSMLPVVRNFSAFWANRIKEKCYFSVEIAPDGESHQKKTHTFYFSDVEIHPLPYAVHTDNWSTKGSSFFANEGLDVSLLSHLPALWQIFKFNKSFRSQGITSTMQEIHSRPMQFPNNLCLLSRAWFGQVRWLPSGSQFRCLIFCEFYTKSKTKSTFYADWHFRFRVSEQSVLSRWQRRSNIKKEAQVWMTLGADTNCLFLCRKMVLKTIFFSQTCMSPTCSCGAPQLYQRSSPLHSEKPSLFPFSVAQVSQFHCLTPKRNCIFEKRQRNCKAEMILWQTKTLSLKERLLLWQKNDTDDCLVVGRVSLEQVPEGANSGRMIPHWRDTLMCFLSLNCSCKNACTEKTRLCVCNQ